MPREKVARVESKKTFLCMKQPVLLLFDAQTLYFIPLSFSGAEERQQNISNHEANEEE